MDRRFVLAVLAVAGACRSAEPGDPPRAATTRDAASPIVTAHDAGSAIVVAAGSSSRWIDRCVGAPTEVSWERAQTDVAVAAATLVLDGEVAPPPIARTPRAPARIFERDVALALATLASGRDGTAALELALSSAAAITDEDARDRALLWGAVELDERGDTDRAARWAAAIRDVDHRHERAAHQVRRLASRGELAAARLALDELPAFWTQRADVEDWPGYPRWLGSAAATACAALAAPAAAASPHARSLLEAAEASIAGIDEPWRQDRALRALALAWARVAATDRAVRAASRIADASLRTDVLAEVLEVSGETRWASRASLDPGLAQLIARRELVEGACERLRRRELAPQQMLATIPYDDGRTAGWIRIAHDVDCAVIAQAIMYSSRLGDRLAGGQLDHLRYLGRLDDATALLQWAWDRMTPAARGDQLAALITALWEAGRSPDAAALLRSLPPHPDAPLVELRVLAAGHQLIAALAIAGHAEDAEALRAELAGRLHRARSATDREYGRVEDRP